MEVSSHQQSNLPVGAGLQAVEGADARQPELQGEEVSGLDQQPQLQMVVEAKQDSTFTTWSLLRLWQSGRWHQAVVHVV